MPVTTGTFDLRCIEPLTLTVAQNGNTSNSVDLGGCWASAIQLPAELNGTTITFEACLAAADGTYGAVKDATGTAVSISFVANDVIALDKAVFAGIRFLRIKCGSSQTSAAREFKLVAVAP